MTQREAAAHFGIPRFTIKNKLKGNQSKPVGRSRVFTEAEEKAFEQHLIKLADYGFPVIEADFRITVKNYLDKKGVKINISKNNFPVYEWVKSFLNRHNNLSVRMSSNIKRVRVQVGLDEINSYMDNFSDVLKYKPPSRIYYDRRNYDETNLSDDPGNKKVICKRGMKYVKKCFVAMRRVNTFHLVWFVRLKIYGQLGQKVGQNMLAITVLKKVGLTQ